MENSVSNCAKCPFDMPDRLCKKEDGKAPPFCPTQNKSVLFDQCLDEYKKSDIYEFARKASIQEGDGYSDRDLGYARVKPLKPRILEIMEFAEKMGYSRLGFVFCVGLRKEAMTVEKLFSKRGFVMVSVVCKVGRMSKEIIGIQDEQQVTPGQFETMCNPILQAFVLNDEKTDFNILMGLCVGHDSLVFQYAEAPCTVLAVKDRVLGHNPLAAIYNIDSYYRHLK